MPGTLFIVSTPIGNLEDISFRALRVLREAALIAAEDTRRTAKLLAHFDIRTPTTSLFEHNEREKLPAVLGRLAAGDHVALVSDAGTPGISDPGYRLVKAAVEAGIRVEAVPGASAVLAILAASGLPTSSFTFAGFPPSRHQARDKWFAGLASRKETLVFFEAPHRIRATLESALLNLGDRPAVVGRELTKLHEELIRGPLSAVLAKLSDPRGEFTVAVAPADDEVAIPVPDSRQLLDEFYHLTENTGVRRREAVTRLAERYGLSSREIYSRLESVKHSVE